jgi:nucleotidyltransferase substrate binding protein (TIGR01987 family)
MNNSDIRWAQRFDNYTKALSQLKNAIELASERDLSELERQGLIQSFEYTHELAWKTIKDFLIEKGNKEIYGLKDATREAFKNGLIDDGEIWMDMIKSRNDTSHTYNEETANEIAKAILNYYYSAFEKLFEKLTELKSKDQ